MYGAFDDLLVTGLAVHWVFQWGLPPEAGYDFLGRALAALLTAADQVRGQELVKGLFARAVARERLPLRVGEQLSSGTVEARHEESGLTWTWSLDE